MEKQQPSSPRVSVWLAGFTILLGVTLIFAGAFGLLLFIYTADSGCRLHYSNYQQEQLSSSLTLSHPEEDRNLTGANAITILSLMSEDDIPVILTIQSSTNKVFLNITHPHNLTENYGSFTLEMRTLHPYYDPLILTLQRTTNDTHVVLTYETYYVLWACVDSFWAPYSAVLISSLAGLILIGIGFRNLNKIGKLASWE